MEDREEVEGSPAVAPPLLVPLSVSVPPPLPLSVAAWSHALALPLPIALAPAAYHRLRPTQEVIHPHVVVVLHDGKKQKTC